MITMQASPFAQIELAPPDPIIGLTEAFNNDANPKKVGLGAGVYQDGAGKVPILGVVREAQERLLEKEETKNYMPIDGIPAFNQQVQALLLGADSGARAVTVQALGGRFHWAPRARRHDGLPAFVASGTSISRPERTS